MATKTKKNAPAPEEKIENALDKTEMFFQKYTKQLIIALVVVLVLVGGYFAYNYLYLQPRMDKAAQEMYVAEQLFAQESFREALEGDGNNPGFRDVVEQYGSTRQGRLAAHYAGICLVKLGEMDEALEYLAKYKPVKGALGVIINAQNFGLQGDIYVQKGDYKTALSMYAKAIDAGDNVLTTPQYLKKSMYVNEEIGDIQAALKDARRIKDEYGASVEANGIDKYIGALEQK